MTTNTQLLVIAGITIKPDEEGRYCLNDMHKAAGGERRHAPSLWLANKQTGDWIRALEAENKGIPVVSSKRGRYGSTYVVRELVYAYAMWISPKFHLEVIRAYDRLATNGVAVHRNAAERQKFWNLRASLRGLLVKYQYFPTGSKEKPRFPSFQGFRNRIDL